jgi:hypothetical protein
MKKTTVTAAELMAKLNADPEFVATRAQAEEERRAREAELRRAEAPLVEALRAAGIAVTSVWDLVNTEAPYAAALPILIDHLQRPYPAVVREGIARALAVPEARLGWDILIRQYRDETETRVRDGLAAAIAVATDVDSIDEVYGLVSDVRNGPSRLLLLSALEHSTDPRSRATLMNLGTDPDLAKEIQVILRRLKRAKR